MGDVFLQTEDAVQVVPVSSPLLLSAVNVFCRDDLCAPGQNLIHRVLLQMQEPVLKEADKHERLKLISTFCSTV